MIRLHVAGRNSLAQQGILHLLEPAQGIKVTGTSAGLPELIDVLANRSGTGPDVILLDLDQSELTVEKLLEGDGPSLRANDRVLALVEHLPYHQLVGLIRQGIQGYLLKESLNQQLVRGIHALAAGLSVIDPAILRGLVEQPDGMPVGWSSPEDQAAVEQLTRREKEVLSHIARGLSTQETADKLFITPKTVRNHISNTMQKLELSNRTQCVLFAIRSGLIYWEPPADD